MKHEKMYSVLREYWGYTTFLPIQEESIVSILEHQDSLTVLPTGGGKSLCFQLPALLMEGTAVIISPLISLMNDQVDHLKEMGVPAECLHSGLPAALQGRVMEYLRKQKIKLLYLSPERLQTESMMNLLQSVKISFFVIDEAHCISHWGHDFRADYRNLGMIKKKFANLNVHTFTATATREVQLDIVKALGLQEAKTHLGRVDRPNLVYRVFPREKIMQQIMDTLTKHPKEAGIIYCLRRKDVDAVSAALQNAAIENVPYHAGLSDEQRHASQEKFSREEVNVVVATIAFGMGIDRSNIRFVIHAGMPKSIEHYQQETGRAGRDGLPAFCYMFYGGGDYRLWRYFAQQSSERETLIKKMGVMYNFCTQPQCRHQLLVKYFGQPFEKDSCDACDYCLKELDMLDDALTVGQKILSCVARVRQNGYGFGAGHVVNILRGKSTEKIERLSHQHLSAFGIMRDHSEPFIHYMIEQLLGQGFLIKDGDYATLALTHRGKHLLKGELRPVLARPLVAKRRKEIAKKAAKRRKEDWADIDEGLFQKLREKRMELAQKKGVPAYIIFSDKTLMDIAAKKPLTKEAFSMIYGVGQSKMDSYAEDFLCVTKGTLLSCKPR